MTDPATPRDRTRAAIVDAAAQLLHDGGPAAVTTRGVAERAGVQAPTIYRLFGDKDGLLEAVAEQVMADFVATKTVAARAATQADVDPLDDLRASWRRQLEFGLGNPAVFRLLSDPDRVLVSAAARAGREVLVARVHRLAEAGLLRVPEEQVVAMIQAAGVGSVQTLLATPVEHRHPHLGEAMLDAVLAHVLVDAPRPATAPATPALTPALALRALAPRLEQLSVSERHLLAEWLDRVIDRAAGAGGSTPQHPRRDPAPPGQDTGRRPA